MQKGVVHRIGRLSRWDVGKALAFGAFPTIPLLAPVGYYAGVPWLSPAIVLVAIPLLDAVLPEDRSGQGPGRPATAAAFLNSIPLAYALTWAGTLIWALHTLSSLALPSDTAAWLMVSTGIGSAFATCAAHEMLHWPERVPRGVARVIMATVAYGPFPIEHLHHHAAVGFRAHGTTPPLGQGLWAYLAENVRHTFTSAWRIERERQRTTRVSIIGNRFVQQLTLTGLALIVFTVVAGALGLVLFVVQAAFGIYTTEFVNYAQHYGLSRDSNAPVSGSVSWSSNRFATNAATLNITRHADHHLNGTLRYYELSQLPGTPTLPAGYLGLFFPAMIPPVWRTLMDERARHVSRPSASNATDVAPSGS